MRVAWDSAFLVLLIVCLGGKVDGEDVCHKQDEDMQRVTGWLVQYATETHTSISLLKEKSSRLNHGIESLKRENEERKTELDILKTNVNNYLTKHAPVPLPSPCALAKLVPREDWGAQNVTGIDTLKTPVSIVTIHNSVRVKTECQTQQECSREMKGLQDLHIYDGYDDIIFNFVIGTDGRAYEGRGWDIIGQSKNSWNDVALSFSVMGSYSYKQPDIKLTQTLKYVIDCGVKLGKISSDYKLYGHRDIYPGSQCPDLKFYDVIKTWAHYDSNTPVKPTP